MLVYKTCRHSKLINYYQPCRHVLYTLCVPSMGISYRRYGNILEGESPLPASCCLILSGLVRDKLVCREACSEESQTAKVCTEEHEVHRRLSGSGERTHQRKAPKQQILPVDATVIDRKNVPLPGEIS